MKRSELIELAELVQGLPKFNSMNHAEKIRFFAWFLHSRRKQNRFMPADIKACYDELSIETPSSVSPFLSEMTKRRPKEALRDSKGYYLERRVRNRFENAYGQRAATVQVTKLLSELPEQIPNVRERDFLKEALICFRHGAFRAAIVMCWNLAFDHLCSFVLKKHLADFNAAWQTRFPNHHKKKVQEIKKRDDFGDMLKESEVVEICKSGKIISGGVTKILRRQLDRRNSAAHPSDIKITQLQAEEFISDLVNNVVIKLA